MILPAGRFPWGPHAKVLGHTVRVCERDRNGSDYRSGAADFPTLRLTLCVTGHAFAIGACKLPWSSEDTAIVTNVSSFDL